MNALVAQQPSVELDPEDQQEELLLEESGGATLPFVLKKLRPRHKQALALIAQGYQNVVVSKMVGYTPTYIGMLLRQPVCLDYIRTINETVAQQLELQYGKVASVIANSLENGTVSEQLKGARLHLEVTKRIGSGRTEPISPESSEERLAGLAHRLIDLFGVQRNASIQQGNPPMQGIAILHGDALSRETQGRLPSPEQNSEGSEEPWEQGKGSGEGD